MKVVFTTQAEADLEAIGDFIARESPLRADAIVAELREKALALADTPKAFAIIGRYRRAAIRRRVHRDYLIFYRLGRNTLTILRILHGA